jgi:hypothetical protein
MSSPSDREFDSIRTLLGAYYDRQIAIEEERTVGTDIATGMDPHNEGARARPRVLIPIGLTLLAVMVVSTALFLRGTAPAPNGAALSSSSAVASNSVGSAAMPSWDGGIPSAIGSEPVLLGSKLTAQIAGAHDSSPFLIGGVVSLVSPGMNCFTLTAPPSLDPAFMPTGSCSDQAMYLLSAGPDGSSVSVFYSPSHPSAPDLGHIHDVVVYRVHVMDPRASSCPANWRQSCQRVVFIDALVWRNGQTIGAGR